MTQNEIRYKHIVQENEMKQCRKQHPAHNTSRLKMYKPNMQTDGWIQIKAHLKNRLLYHNPEKCWQKKQKQKHYTFNRNSAPVHFQLCTTLAIIKKVEYNKHGKCYFKRVLKKSLSCHELFIWKKGTIDGCGSSTA